MFTTVVLTFSHFLAGNVQASSAGNVRATLAPRLGHSLPPQEPKTYAKAVENIVFQRLGATSENLDDGEIFTLRLPFSDVTPVDSSGLLILMHRHR